MPHQADWTLDALNWHRDVSKSQLRHIPGVQAFVLLDDLSAKGGATLALAGSHRLQSQHHAKQAIAKLTTCSTGSSVTVSSDIELSVVEMMGQAGDVYLMDMRLLHTPSINSGRKVRIMATSRYYAAY